MKHFKSFILLAALVISTTAFTEDKGMQVFESKKMETVIAPKENFSGKVKVTRFFQAKDPATVSSALVEFDEMARSNWHTHPMGQTLIVTEGAGRIQEWGKPVQNIKKGDVIWTPPGVKHWHGGGTDSKMSHIAVQESQKGKTVDWLEPVKD